MTDYPDPTDDVLHCQTCSAVIRDGNKRDQRGVWMRRDNDDGPDDRELLCLDCAIDEVRDPETASRQDVRGLFLSGLVDTPDPRLDYLVERDDSGSIDGNDEAERLGITLTEFGELVECDPRFEYGTSPRFPWINMASYRKWPPRQGNRGDNQ